jgi:hypothetical protein
MKALCKIILIILFCFSRQNICNAQTSKLDSVKVEVEDFDTETVFDMSCENFDSSFRNTKKIMKFNNESDLLKFKGLLKYFKQQKSRSIDVRGSIIYYYTNKSIKYCFSEFGVFYNNGRYYYNKELLMYITDKFYGHHPKYLDTLRQP